MTVPQTLTIVGLALLPALSVALYLFNKQREEIRVKIPVRIHEDENPRR